MLHHVASRARGSLQREGGDAWCQGLAAPLHLCSDVLWVCYKDSGSKSTITQVMNEVSGEPPHSALLIFCVVVCPTPHSLQWPSWLPRPWSTETAAAADFRGRVFSCPAQPA